MRRNTVFFTFLLRDIDFFRYEVFVHLKVELRIPKRLAILSIHFSLHQRHREEAK